VARAAATFFWKGGTDGTWNTPGNWLNSSGTAYTDAYPGYDVTNTANVDGDAVMLDSAPTTALAGHDASASGDLAAFRVTSGYTGAIGTSGTPVIFDMTTTGNCVIDGSQAADMYISGGGTHGLVGLIVNGTKSGKVLYLGGTIVNPLLKRGTVDIAATAIITTGLTISYISSVYGDVALAVNAGATLPTSVDVQGGTSTCAVAIADLRISDGQWTQTAGDITALEITRGTLIHKGGNIIAGKLAGGSLDCSQSTVARSIGDMSVDTAATLNLNNGQGNVTWTALRIQGGAGNVTFAAGTVL
jgi:hypothetical protein